jgi:hypothetical protein
LGVVVIIIILIVTRARPSGRLHPILGVAPLAVGTTGYPYLAMLMHCNIRYDRYIHAQWLFVE